MFKKSATLATALAAVAMLAAPAAALADDVAPDAPVLEEATTAPETPVVVDVPAPVLEEPVVTDAPAPVVEEPSSPPAPPVVEEAAPPVEVAPTPQTQTLKWTLPNGGTPDNVTWPQPVFSPGSIPCGTSVWVQVDTYPYTTDEDKARTDALAADGVLTKGEDYGWAQSWTFERFVAPACPLTEIPYPALLADVVCGPDNDTVTVDPAWIEQYGHLVAGPWIDTKYKTINGERVVDGSAQIKAEFRKTHIWAGTSATTASDFRRWMMYPGTSPFTHTDAATECPVVVDPPVEEPPVVTPPVVTPPVVEPAVVVAQDLAPAQVETAGLAETGSDTATLWTFGAIAAALLTAGGIALTRRKA